MPPVPQRARRRAQPQGPNGQFLPGPLPHVPRAPQHRQPYRSRLNLNDRGQVQRRKILVAIAAKRPRISGHFYPGSITTAHIAGRPHNRRQPIPNPAGHRQNDENAIIKEKTRHYHNHPQVYQTNFLSRLTAPNREYNIDYLKRYIL